jgi:outer membrane lipoprotein-sorting protein
VFLTVVLLAATAAPADDPAEAAFRKMEKKLADAGTLSLKFTAEIEPKKVGNFKGRLAAAPGNKFRVELEGTGRGKEGKMVMVSDGMKMRTSDPTGMEKDQDTRKDMGVMIRVAVARTGLLAPLFLMTEARSADDPPKKEEFDKEKTFAVSGFKFVGKKKEYGKADGGEGVGVEYTVTFKGMKEPLKVTTWIDPKTDLPVKRTLTADVGGGATVTITETYTDVTVGGKADDKDFVLPK